MKAGQNHSIQHHSAARWHWALVGAGVAVIAALLWVFVSTVDDHMRKAHEVSRDTQWHAHAPVEGADAAVLLQGGEP